MSLIIGLACLSFLEVVITVLLTNRFGAVLTYSLFAVPTIIGVVVQWRRQPILKAAWAKIREAPYVGDTYEKRMHRTRPSFQVAFQEVLTYWVSVFLLLIPGPLTALVAFGLMAPFVRRLLTKKVLMDSTVERRQLQEWKRRHPKTFKTLVPVLPVTSHGSDIKSQPTK